MARNGWGRSGVGPPDGTVVEDAVEDRLDQQSDQALGRARDGHQDHGAEQMRPVAAAIAQQAQEFVHAWHPQARKGVEHLRRVLRAGRGTISEAVRHGPQMAGSDAPKMTTTGTPKAAAMWAGPESLPTKSEARLQQRS